MDSRYLVEKSWQVQAVDEYRQLFYHRLEQLNPEAATSFPPFIHTLCMLVPFAPPKIRQLTTSRHDTDLGIPLRG